MGEKKKPDAFKLCLKYVSYSFFNPFNSHSLLVVKAQKKKKKKKKEKLVKRLFELRAAENGYFK